MSVGQPFRVNCLYSGEITWFFRDFATKEIYKLNKKESTLSTRIMEVKAGQFLCMTNNFHNMTRTIAFSGNKVKVYSEFTIEDYVLPY